jgi:hypothetical protein
MKFARLNLSLLIASVMIMSACSNPLSNLFGNPSTPSATPTTDTFSGNLAPSGALVFTFSVGTAGSVAVTLTAVSPATTSPLGLGIGQSASDGSCTVANSTSGATAGGSPQLSANENPGNYCVKVSDAGSLATTSAVTVTVSHP